jgi:hypothetical protein
VTGAPIQTTMDSGRRWAALIALLTMFLTLVPYLIGYSFADKRVFMWLGYNLDDSCVYLSWMRQAADGSFRALNLFTTDEQHGMLLNPLFLVLGWFARLTHLPLLAVYHLSRLVFGFALVMLVWEFLLSNISNPRTRKLALLTVCFSSGLGWLPFFWNQRFPTAPIDTWQPEAITFLSLYLSPLFCFSLALQIGILLLLQMGERTGRARFAFSAGICGLILGFVHTYDIISLSAIWGIYLLVRIVVTLRSHGSVAKLTHSWLCALIAGALTAPAVAYIAWQLHTETVFQQRAAVQTLSPSLLWVVIGYGFTLLCALLGVYSIFRSHSTSGSSTSTNDPNLPFIPGDTLMLLLVWGVMNLIASYLPVSFQRKMLQGEHFPIAILAGIGIAWIFSRSSSLQQRWRLQFASALTLFILGITNLLFVLRDISDFEENRAQTGIQRTYLQPGELEALEWVRTNTPEGTAIQPLPWIAIIASQHKIAMNDIALATFTPGLIHRKVYCGHWGETPDFNTKTSVLTTLLKPNTSEQDRIQILRSMKVQYLIFSQKNPQDEDADMFLPIFRGKAPLPPYLVRVYGNSDADVYEIRLP